MTEPPVTDRLWMRTHRPARRNRPVTHACCSRCRLRFDVVAAARLPACPDCGDDLRAVLALESVVGFRLFKLRDFQQTPLPVAVAVALPLPHPWLGR